jgi:hypothetical protein
LALVLKVFRNRFSCHGPECGRTSTSKLSNFGHSVTINLPPRTSAGLASTGPNAPIGPHRAEIISQDSGKKLIKMDFLRYRHAALFWYTAEWKCAILTRP